MHSVNPSSIVLSPDSHMRCSIGTSDDMSQRLFPVGVQTAGSDRSHRSTFGCHVRIQAVPYANIPRLAEIVQSMVRGVIEAFSKANAAIAETVIAC